MLNFKINAFWLQKQGNHTSEYEDAWDQYPPGRGVRAESCRLAIADGASESSFANIWAKQLVRSYCIEPFLDLPQIQERIHLLAERWHHIVFRRPLAWYAEEKARLGAFATFLGLQISTQKNQPAGSGFWQATAIGDSCFFLIHRDEIHISWPVVHSECFNNSPALLGSRNIYNDAVWRQVLFQQGMWHEGDLLILATDALAAWFLKEVENNRKPWNELAGFMIESEPAISFRRWAAQMQAEKEMRNDDVTCLIVQLG
jgi:hypothetical protein